MTLEASPGSRTRPMRDEGVSPVVGMILVLAISVLGIAAILYWGLPAIDEMKANVEHRSVQGQFQDLDATLKELVAGTTEKTAKRWDPTLNRGEIGVRNDTESWLFTADGYQEDSANGAQYNWLFDGLSDGDNGFTIKNNAAGNVPGAQVYGYVVGAGNSLTQINLTCVDCGTTAGQQTASIATWNAGSTHTFAAYVDYTTNHAAASYLLDGGPFYFKINNGTPVVGEAWYMNTSAIQYKLHAGVVERSVTENNGAIITGTGTTYAMLNSPPIPPPKTVQGTHRFFARALVLNGTASAAGDNQFDLLVSLYSTSVLATYDCTQANHYDCIAAAKIQVWGTMKSPWYSYLTDSGRGYSSIQRVTSGSYDYLEDRQTMGYTLIESALNMG